MKFVPIAVAALFVAGRLAGQAVDIKAVETRTIELRHLKPQEAVNLLRPYLVSGAGSVSLVSEQIPVVTIRDLATNLEKMEKVLAKYDHSPATIRLIFQLIEADTGARMISASNTRNLLPLDLDSTLRSVLKFPTYRLLAQGVATVGEFSSISQQLANAEQGGMYELSADIGTVRIGTIAGDTSAKGSVHIRVSLGKTNSFIGDANSAARPYERIISTGLDVPLGHTVVLGTAATRMTGTALILTVKPELVRAK